MQKLLLIAGALLILIGFGWPWLRKLPIGRLPGDFVYRGENVTIYFPLMTLILVSVLLSILFRLFR